MKKVLVAAALAAFFVSPVHAQDNRCGPSARVSEMLSLKYGEEVIETIRKPNKYDTDQLIQYDLWLNDETGTWTGTATFENGMTCIGPSGQELNGRTISDFLEPAGVEL